MMAFLLKISVRTVVLSMGSRGNGIDPSPWVSTSATSGSGIPHYIATSSRGKALLAEEGICFHPFLVMPSRTSWKRQAATPSLLFIPGCSSGVTRKWRWHTKILGFALGRFFNRFVADAEPYA